MIDTFDKVKGWNNLQLGKYKGHSGLKQMLQLELGLYQIKNYILPKRALAYSMTQGLEQGKRN